MLTTSTSPGISQRTTVWAAREMLKHAVPALVLEKTGPLVTQMPKNKGVNLKFRRPVTLDAITTPMAEGVTPTATAFRFVDVPATLRQYGQVVEITDVIEDTHEDPVLQQIVVQLGENIGRSTEALDWATLIGGTSVQYGNGSARTDVNTPVSLNGIRAVSRTLKRQKAMPITQVMDGSPDYATFPIEGGFVLVGHTNLESDFRNLAGFKTTAEYGSRKTISPYEIGSIEDFRVLLSPDLDVLEDAGGAKAGSGATMVSSAGTSADVYPVVAFGKEAWGKVSLRGFNAVEPSIIPVNQKTKDDPLGQRGVAGWKAWHSAVILNDAWMVRYEVAATSL